MSNGRVWKAATLCLVLGASACATGSASPTRWAPREGANFAADKAACVAETKAVDIKSANGYSDARYGVAAAMAGRMDRNDMSGSGVDRLYHAIEDACMTRKGWTPAQ